MRRHLAPAELLKFPAAAVLTTMGSLIFKVNNLLLHTVDCFNKFTHTVTLAVGPVLSATVRQHQLGIGGLGQRLTYPRL